MEINSCSCDPGNDKGTYQKAGQEKVIEFFADGSLRSTRSFFQRDANKTNGMSGTYLKKYYTYHPVYLL